MTSASSEEETIFWAGRPALRRFSWSSSRPVCSVSSRDSALNHCLILLRARVELLHLALRREHLVLVLEQVVLAGLHDLLGVLRVLLPVELRAQPLELRL